MVTLTGTGGIGKTRLALHVAERVMRRFLDGVRFIDMSEAADPGQVMRFVAEALQVVENHAHNPVEAIVTALRTQELLLVLDTCEYAAATVAELCTAVLRHCPQVRILATSRQPLRLAEENIWRVPPLSLPARPTPTDLHSPEPVPIPRRDALRYESVRLFVTRAHSARADFEMTRENSGYIAEICRMLDGVPLAIELAAARVRVLSVQQILRRLDDRFRLLTTDTGGLPPRQRTLRAVLEWSHELLDDCERDLLHRLSIFSTWYLELAEEVCGTDGIDAADVLRLHFSLLDKSLIVIDTEVDGTAHYRLTHTVRAYAAERLAESGGEDARWDRYLRYSVTRLESLAKTASTPLSWGERLSHLRLLDHHRENTARVLSWALGQGRVEEGLRICVALRPYWIVRGLFADGSHILGRLLEQHPERQCPRLRARGLALYAELRLGVDTAASVAATARRAVDEARRAGEHTAAASALTTLAFACLRAGAVREGQHYCREALELAERGSDPFSEVAALTALALLARRQGDVGRAARFLAQGVAVADSLGDRWSVARCLHGLGSIAAERGTHDEAERRLEEALAVFTELGVAEETARCAAALGRLCLARGDIAAARRHLSDCLRNGFTSGRRIAVARALEALTELALAERSPERAASLAGVAQELRNVLDQPSPQTAVLRSRVERELGTGRAARAWAAWQPLPLERVLDEALSFPEPARAPGGSAPLTPRETEIARLAGQGLSNRQIAERLTISQATAARHIANIFRKLSITSRTQLTGWSPPGEDS